MLVQQVHGLKLDGVVGQYGGTGAPVVDHGGARSHARGYDGRAPLQQDSKPESGNQDQEPAGQSWP
jgi:hypothetical protein